MNYQFYNVSDRCVHTTAVDIDVCSMHFDFSARCTNRRPVAMLSVCLSVCLSGTDVHCDYTVHVSADLNLWFDSPVFWAPWHQSMSTYSQPSFYSIPPGREVGYG